MTSDRPTEDLTPDDLAKLVDEEVDEERRSVDPDPTRRENYGVRLQSLDDAVHEEVRGEERR